MSEELPDVVVWGDGVHDDSAALQAIYEGKARGVKPDGTPWLEPPERRGG